MKIKRLLPDGQTVSDEELFVKDEAKVFKASSDNYWGININLDFKTGTGTFLSGASISGPSKGDFIDVSGLVFGKDLRCLITSYTQDHVSAKGIIVACCYAEDYGAFLKMVKI